MFDANLLRCRLDATAMMRRQPGSAGRPVACASIKAGGQDLGTHDRHLDCCTALLKDYASVYKAATELEYCIEGALQDSL